MTYFSQLDQNGKAKALGSNIADASNGILFSKADTQKTPLQLVQQFLIIGLGGSGTQTVDRIKGELNRQYTWDNNKLAFLAIDTDKSGMNTLLNLSPSEKYTIKDVDHIKDRYNIPENRTEFTKEWIHPDFNENFYGEGANRIRPVCHAKMFDEAGGSSADQKLIASIQGAANPFVNGNSTEVIVILGVSGGTGSGGIINIAHFVRKALAQRGSFNVTGYFYMPDVFRYPEYSISKKSNGYAALKELDYYYCARQRTVPEFLKSHDGPSNPLRVDRNNLLYDTAFLVSGSVDGAIVDPYNTAIGAVKESVVNILTENQVAIAKAAQNAGNGNAPVFMMAQFKANSDTARNDVLSDGFGHNTNGLSNGTETIGFYGDDVYNYNAIGVGSVSVPREIIKCYAVDQVVHKVLAFTDPADANVAGASWSDTHFTAADGANKVKLLLNLTPDELKGKIANICKFDYTYDSSVINRKTILAGTAATALTTGVGLDKPAMVKDQFMTAIKNEIDEAYSKFEGELTEFLKKRGPKAFKNLYRGVGSDQNYFGIEDVLNGYRIKTRDDAGLQPNAEKALNDAEKPLKDTFSGAVYAVLNPGACNTWVTKYLENEATKIAYEISNGIYGKNKYYDTGYLSKVRTLCEECCEFAEVLEGLTNTYENLSNDFSDYNRYSQWLNDHASGRVYDCIRTQNEYNWAKNEVDQALNNVNYRTIRNDLVETFMENRDQWICYEEGMKMPRKAFDAFIGPQVTFTDELITAVTYIQYKVAAGTDLNTVADTLVNELVNKSVPLFNKDPGIAAVNMTTGINRYLLAPAGIFTNNANVQQAFRNACSGNNNRPQIAMQESAGVDNFVMFTQKGGLPIFAVSELKDWEFEYNRDLRRLHRNESGKEDFDPATGLEWKDYPYLSHERNPRTPDAVGNISAEGKFLREKLDPLWNEAVEAGVIQEKTDANGKYYYEYSNLIHLPAWDLSFDAATWPTDADGLLLKGQDLFAYFANRHGKTLQEITKPIRLEDQGAFSMPNPNRVNALDWAKRSLRKNVPMYLEVKKTLAAVKALIPAIDAENEKRKTSIFAAKAAELAPKYIACGLLNKLNDDAAKWCFLNEKMDSSDVVTKLKPVLMGGDDLNRKRLTAGLTYPALVGKFAQYMQAHGEIDFNTAYKTVWGAMLDEVNNEETTMHGKFKERLEDFVKEAKTFLAKYYGPAKVIDRAALLRQLDANDDYNQLRDCYQAIITEDMNMNL